VLFNAPGMSADHVSGLLFNASSVSDAQSLSNQNAINPETISLAAAILGMLLIALVGVGGFTATPAAISSIPCPSWKASR
jgi:hypothetical protein